MEDKVSVADAASTEHIRAADLLRYVRAHGWKRLPSVRANSGYEFYSPPQADDSGRVHRIAIPISDESSALRAIVEQVIGIAAAIEGRNIRDVISDILSVAVDSIDVRIIPMRGGNRIPLSAAQHIYGSLQRLLAASEKTERRLANSGDKIGSSKVWLLPAVPRSFAFRIESVIALDTDTMLGEPAAVPIAHKAVCRVLQGLDESQKAVDADGWTSTSTSLTAAMCDALVDLHKAVDGSDIEFTHSLSPKYDVPAGLLPMGTVRYNAPMAAQLVGLQSALHGVREPIESLDVSGHIIELKNKRATPDRERQLALPDWPSEYNPKNNVVYIQVTWRRTRARIGRLHFTLHEKDYRDACKAHANGDQIHVRGTPVLKAGKWVLDPVHEYYSGPRRRTRRRA